MDGCDATECSLREAIVAANEASGEDAIGFAIPGDGPHAIVPTSALPAITDALTIDGYTQAGAQPAGVDAAATLLIEVSGTGQLGPHDGLTISDSNSTVRGLVVNGFRGNEIMIGGRPSAELDNITIAGNYIGIDVSGSETKGDPERRGLGGFPNTPISNVTIGAPRRPRGTSSAVTSGASRSSLLPPPAAIRSSATTSVSPNQETRLSAGCSRGATEC